MRLSGTPPSQVPNVASKPRRKFARSWAFGILTFAAVVVSGVAFAYRFWPRSVTMSAGLFPSVAFTPAGIRVFVPNRRLVGEIAEFDDELFAFLMYDYLRSRTLLVGKTIMLASREEQGQPVFRILVRLPDNFMDGVEVLAQLNAARLTSTVQLDWVTADALESYIQQTALFRDAYNAPVAKRLKAIHVAELEGYLRRFIRFKSQTDPRISRALVPIPSPLTKLDASHLAADIIAVAHFYNIPIDLFLGVGAMENNYMNVPGDLKNTIWKKLAESGDIVLRRRSGRVLVRNDSQGVWQITRESLRYAHQLFQRDKRNYADLPERLRPARALDLDAVDSEVLTTYAGLLLRDLLDRFHGDVPLTAGAYNGGPRNPNARYATGVQMVADYAHRVIVRANEIDRARSERNSDSNRKIHDALKAANKEATDRPQSQLLRLQQQRNPAHRD